MFRRSREAARTAFDAQFEAVPEGVDFRPNGVGEPFRLTEAERAEATARFERDFPRYLKAWAAALILMPGAYAVLIRAGDPLRWIVLAAMAALTAAILWWGQRLMTAPARTYAGRQVAGRAHGWGRALDDWLQRQPWWPLLATPACIIALMAWSLYSTWPGFDLIWSSTGMGVVSLAMFAVLALRKLRLPPKASRSAGRPGP